MCSAERQRQRYKLIVVFIVLIVNYARSAWREKGQGDPDVLKVGALNVNALKDKIGLVKYYLHEYQFDIFVIGESKIRGVATEHIRISGYSCEREDRTQDDGGGVVIYIRDRIPYEPESVKSVTVEPGPLQYIHVQLDSGWDIVGIYLPPVKSGKRPPVKSGKRPPVKSGKRPPGPPRNKGKVMKAKLQTTTTTKKPTPEERGFSERDQRAVLNNTLLHFQSLSRENMILLGDFNIHLERVKTERKVNLIASEAGFRQLKKEEDNYTFQYKRRNYGVSYLDHIYVKRDEKIIESGVIENVIQLAQGYVDLHHLIFCYVRAVPTEKRERPGTTNMIDRRPMWKPRLRG